MSFQTDDLSMLTLGILGDAPPLDSGQPPLPNGMHLRWSPDQERGFPWYGFYLFRRETRPSRPRCLAPELHPFPPGAPQIVSLDTTIGRLSSASPLVFTDDFPPVQLVEVDLRSGLRFDLPAGVEAASVDLRIGLGEGNSPPLDCIDFRSFALGTGPSPRTEKGVVFDAGSPAPGQPRPTTSIGSWNGSPNGLILSFSTTITLPDPSSRVDLRLTNREALRITTTPPMASGPVDVKAGELSQSVLTLTGEGITQISIFGRSATAGLLHEFCLEGAAASPPTPAAAAGSGIEVRALAGAVLVSRTLVRGAAGQVVSASLAGAGINAVEIGPGRGALVDLCYRPKVQGATFGWEAVRGFSYPLCLPVAHPDYPCPSKPATFVDAQALAFSRVTYHAPPGWDQDFPALHDELVALVQGGLGGGPMASRKHPDLKGQPLSPATQDTVPTLPDLSPLDQVFLASLQPAFAQMLGLYFVDPSVATGVGYDYILLADPTGVLGGSAASALDWLAFTADMTQVDAVLVSNVQATTRTPIAPPAGAHAYALPGPAAREIDGSLSQVAGSVGLWWPLPPDSTVEDPDRLLIYSVKRASLGPTEPVSPPADLQYQAVTGLSSILISEPDPQNPPEPPNPRSSDWPPPSIPLFAVNGNLAEGWYSYRLSGQTLFGRRSPMGLPAEWFEWDPLPAHLRHPFAVALLDKTPPPIPLGVEAWALDPPDRWVLMDQPYLDWREDNPDLVGLRVRWRWTWLQQIQAPDTREFRLYYQPGRWNALLGRIVKVTPITAAPQSDVDLDVPDSRPVNAFAGARLRVGNNDFAILGSQPGAQLRLRVKNLGADGEVSPAEGKPCTVAIPDQHALWVDSGLLTSWAKRLTFVPYDPPARTVTDPSKDKNEQPLTSDNDAFKTVQVTVNGQDVLFGAGPDLSGIQPWIDHLWLKSGAVREAYPIVRYDNSTRIVTLTAAPALAGPPDAWILGRPAREYDVFLPAPDVGVGQPFEPSLEEPAVYAQIAVSAADDKVHTLDDPKWNDPARFGNESRLSPSATVFRVLQTPPPAPDLPELGDRLYATPADFHSRSYSTFRFTDPKKPLKVHILRAVDDSLFKRDWIIRETRKALDPANAKHLDYFPDGTHWDPATREIAAAEVNALAQGAPYSGLSADAWAVLALLPGNEGQPDKTALEARDKLLRKLRGQLTVTDDVFPTAWSPATRSQAAGFLNGIVGLTDYASLPDNALRILAGLPGNEAAFTQVTLAPLEMTDPTIQDERRPDDDAAYPPQPINIRAYTDTLPGRATNRYFYRARFVDGAQNQGSLSLAGPPVYLRKVEPPRAPVISKVLGGERTITIGWASNQEPDLREYRVFRASTLEAARELRLMTQVHTEPADPDPLNRPAEVAWKDQGLAGNSRLFYRVVAVDHLDNVSPPCAEIFAVAVDTSVPDPPVWTEIAWVLVNEIDGREEDFTAAGVGVPGKRPAVRLTWTSPVLAARFTVLRRSRTELVWRTVGSGLEVVGNEEYRSRDDSASPTLSYLYRVVVKSASGIDSVDTNDIEIARPL